MVRPLDERSHINAWGRRNDVTKSDYTRIKMNQVWDPLLLIAFTHGSAAAPLINTPFYRVSKCGLRSYRIHATRNAQSF